MAKQYNGMRFWGLLLLSAVLGIGAWVWTGEWLWLGVIFMLALVIGVVSIWTSKAQRVGKWK